MIDKKIFDELRFLLDEAEERIWRRSEKVLLDMYWHIGYCLREYPEKDMDMVSKELSLLFHADKEMFCTAYRFYKDNPLKKKAVRWSG